MRAREKHYLQNFLSKENILERRMISFFATPHTCRERKNENILYREICTVWYPQSTIS